MSTSVEITWLLAAVAKGDAVAFERLYGATCANLYSRAQVARKPLAGCRNSEITQRAPGCADSAMRAATTRTSASSKQSSRK